MISAALDLGRVQRIDLGTALAVVLKADAQREIEERAEAAVQIAAVRDLAADVADDAAQPGAQEFELAPRALELMSVGVAASSGAEARLCAWPDRRA